MGSQLDRKILSASSGVPKGVADGQYVVGLNYQLYYATYLADNIPVTAVHAEEGSLIVSESITIVMEMLLV